MGITFAVRGNSLDARYSSAGKTPGLYKSASGGEATVDANAGALSGSLINMKATGTNVKGIIYPGRENWVSTNSFSCLMRIKPNYSGSPTNPMPFWTACGPSDNIGGEVQFWHAATGLINARIRSENATNIVNAAGSSWSPVSGTYYDILFTYDATLTTGALKIYIDNSLHTTLNGASTYNAAGVGSLNRNRLLASALAIGFVDTGVVPLFDLDEFVIWDEVVNPASVALVSGTGALNGASRTSLVNVAAYDALSFSDPGVANVLSSASYTYAGASQTGTYVAPSTSNVKTGIAFGAASALTGTYDGSDRWSSPGVANVRLGTQFKENSTTNNRTGTLDLPAESNVKTGVSFDGASKNGTYDGSDRWSDLLAAEVKIGTAYKANSTTNNRTGTYDGSDRHSDPGVANVLSPVQYQSNSLSNNRTGTYVPPTPDYPAESDVREGIVYDSGASTGTLDLPAESDVATGVTYDNGTKEGTRNVVTNNVSGGHLIGNKLTGTLREEN